MGPIVCIETYSESPVKDHLCLIQALAVFLNAGLLGVLSVQVCE